MEICRCQKSLHHVAQNEGKAGRASGCIHKHRAISSYVKDCNVSNRDDVTYITRFPSPFGLLHIHALPPRLNKRFESLHQILMTLQNIFSHLLPNLFNPLLIRPVRRTTAVDVAECFEEARKTVWVVGESFLGQMRIATGFMGEMCYFDLGHVFGGFVSAHAACWAVGVHGGRVDLRLGKYWRGGNDRQRQKAEVQRRVLCHDEGSHVPRWRSTCCDESEWLPCQHYSS
jgi:hypothetical protein